MGGETDKRNALMDELTYEMVLTLLEYINPKTPIHLAGTNAHLRTAGINFPRQFNDEYRIATQDTLLEMKHVQRYLEIGPANTLTSMLKKTLAQDTKAGALGEVPTCLTCSDEFAELSKPIEDEPEEEEVTQQDAGVPAAPVEVSQPTHMPLPTVPVAAPRDRAVVQIDDAPVPALDALLAIVTSGLKTSKANINTGQSIKFLAKGRSALQNEIIGNLVAEFGELPDAAEETALLDLGQALQRTFSGKLGSYLLEWLTNKISAKLAPSVTLSKIRVHLRDSFGLKENRQSTVLISADINGIPSRLDEAESWNTVNRWADSYMRENGLERVQDSAGTPDSTRPADAQETFNSPQLAMLGRDLADLMSKHFKSDSTTEAGSAPGRSNASAQESMERMISELGEEFIAGTKPYFRPELVYKYESGWNWAVQDLYVTLSKIISMADGNSEDKMQSKIDSASQRIHRRATPRLIRCAEYLLEKWQSQKKHRAAKYCVMLLQQVLAGITPTQKGPARFDSRMVPHSIVTEDGEILCEEVPSGKLSSFADETSSWDVVKSSCSSSETGTPSSYSMNEDLTAPRVCTREGSSDWKTNVELTTQLHETRLGLREASICPVPGTILIIGAGRKSIGFHVVRQLLELGCRVALCTTRLTPSNRRLYSKLYAEVARPGAELVLLPFNQGSVKDIGSLVDYINGPLGWEIDHLVPFAALPELGKTLEDLDSTSELSHRIMLTNTLRLIGAIAASKRRRQILNHCTQVILPLSSNNGQIGGDGLYVESKVGLEAIMTKWNSEAWSESISLCAAKMGWTRGTALMEFNDALAAEAEKRLGIRTFSAHEMAELLISTMAPDLLEACSLQPLLCDFGGGMQAVQNLSKYMHDIRSSLETTASIKKRLKQEAENENTNAGPRDSSRSSEGFSEPRAKIRSQIPILPARYEDAVSEGTTNLEGILDLDSTVVITGFAELGSAGSSRTRWDLEATGEFSLEGCVELAWMTGLIQYEHQRLHNGSDIGPGWVECKSKEPIRDIDVKSKFEGHLREHTGIRLLDPDQWSNLEPHLRNMLHEVGAEEDLPPFECSTQAAEAFKARHGDHAEILSDDGTTAKVRIRQGASIFVPKAIKSEYFAAAQIPTGWDASRYGVPEEVLTQADRPALYALTCVAEAFVCAGITDVYELYKYVHVSEVGNCISSGAGGVTAIQAFHEQRLLGKQVQSDILSESFIGTAAAWVNLMLLSSSGPLKTAAGTCASSLESLDTACDLIRSGRTQMCLAGGWDVFTRPVFYEFGEMGAILNTAEDIQRGREPKEMSRPFTSTRNGFVLSEGAGVQVVTNASLAIKMGLPIYGVVAMTYMASDKIGRSIPAPGRGLLTAAKQAVTGHACALLDPKTRAKRIKTSLGHVDRQCEEDVEDVMMEMEARLNQGVTLTADEIQARVDGIKKAAELEKKVILREIGSNYWRNDTSISPITGALSVFGLTVQDITFASLHGTATKMNDYNECATLDRQMRHLGRHPGNPIFAIAQKSVVGHGVGASGAWALNGALQAMHSGIIPGNRNADNIEKRLEAFENVFLANENINIDPAQIKAFTVTSFGFGQKGAQVIVVHPRYLFSAISKTEYDEYRIKQMKRARLAERELDRGLHGEGMVKSKEATPYVGDEYDFLLNPLMRAETVA